LRYRARRDDRDRRARIIHSFSSAAERLFGFTPAEVIGSISEMPTPIANHDGYLDAPRTGERESSGSDVVVGERRLTTFPMELAVGEMRSSNQRFFTVHPRPYGRQQPRQGSELQSELVHISRLTAMGEMASALAHELNQPLSAIANYMKGSDACSSGADVVPPAS
jgi:two-component system sensor kinase FixL